MRKEAEERGLREKALKMKREAEVESKRAAEEAERRQAEEAALKRAAEEAARKAAEDLKFREMSEQMRRDCERRAASVRAEPATVDAGPVSAAIRHKVSRYVGSQQKIAKKMVKYGTRQRILPCMFATQHMC